MNLLNKYFKIFCIYFVILSVICLFGCSKSDKDESIPVDYSYIINSINHRGYYTAPENTLAAFYASYQNGFTMVECDVSFTKDGYAVIIHDDFVDRTSNGAGKIGSLTLEEVRALDFGSWKSPEFTGEKIPTFEEFIALCRDFSLRPYIEIKGATAEQAKLLVNTVIDFGMNDKVTWISFSKSHLKSVLEVDLYARVGFLTNSITEESIHKAVDLRTDNNNVFINCNFRNVDSDAIEMCKNSLVPLEVWTVNEEQDILNLDPYISGVTSDMLIAGKVIYENDHNVERK